MGRPTPPVPRLEPLWLRVERNRLKLVAFLAVFCLAAALAAQVVVTFPFALGVGIVYAYMTFTTLTPEVYGAFDEVLWLTRHMGQVSLAIGAAAALVAAAYAAYALTRPLRRQLGAIGARFVPLGEMLPTKNALKDMSIAAGVVPAPELHVIDSDSANAFVIARGRQRPVCAVTSGLVRKLDVAEQRAVFANLLSRLRSGDVAWATAVSALMSPVWRWRDADLSAEDDILDPAGFGFLSGDRSGPTYVSTLMRNPAAARGGMALAVGAIWAFLTYSVAVVASELVGAGQRRSHLLAAEAADAEGMLLLKEPAVMLSALRKAIELDNRVRMAVPMYAGLFYIWAGDDLAEDDDPEWRRLDRLREVCGVEGLEDAAEEEAAAAEVRDALEQRFAPLPPAAEDARKRQGAG